MASERNHPAFSEPSHHSLSWAFQTYLVHDNEERSHWADVYNAFRYYAEFALCNWANQRHRVASLPECQQKFLPNGLRNTVEGQVRFQQYKEAAIANQFCLDSILGHAGMPHSQQNSPSTTTTTTTIASDDQFSKVSSVLKSLARDWSLEGKSERDMAYGPILKKVEEYLPISELPKYVPRICVPGAGVGRLVFELVSRGYRVQGNEFSLYMLLASDFLLNSGMCHPENPMEISPWLLESRNLHSSMDAVRYVSIPDVVIGVRDDNRLPDDFSMAAGDFKSIYGHPREASKWDSVVCCFFLDASPNIVECIQIIHQMLKVGGVLVNFGPLLYHWSGPAMRPDDGSTEEYQSRFAHLDRRYMESVDLSWEDVREVLINVGFDIVEETVGVNALYTADRRSMMNVAYRCIHFVARKRP